LPSGAEQLREGGLRPADVSAADEFNLRTGFLPSLDVHGLASGEPDAVKTVIPAEATATLSLRLAPGQSAEAIAPIFERLLDDAAPPGCELTIEPLGNANPVLVSTDDQWLSRAADGIESAIGMRPALVRTGGSIPIMAYLAARGITPILTGFALPDDAIHAPNERMRVANLELGVRAGMGILEALGT
jgi:acetylornithine deacetylase/succinyl-diaminopimelate desuccinylase-like protein